MKPFEPEAKVFKALMHPARLAILNELREDEHCVCHLEAKLGLRQAYISQQLMVLREAGLVEDHRDGWNVFYQVVDPAIFDALEAVHHIANKTDEALPLPKPSIRQSKACPCPKCKPGEKY